MPTKKAKNKKELKHQEEINWIIKEYSKTWTALKEYDEREYLDQKEIRKKGKENQ